MKKLPQTTPSAPTPSKVIGGISLNAVGIFVLALSGCVETVGRGPDLGLCAVTPDGLYAYGEIGIGKCLAGPTDMVWVEKDGRPWLAISNADPFVNFTGGSVLFLDWEDMKAQLRRETVYTHELSSTVVPTEHFIGGLGWIADRDLLIVTRRLSEAYRTRTGPDSAYVIDVAKGEFLGGDPSGDASQLPLEEDPGDVAIEDSTDRAFVLNYSDHSVSVFDTSSGPIRPIDLAPEASIEPFPLDDADGDGSVAEISRVSMLVPTLVTDDLWSLDYIPGQARIWAPNGYGLDRFSWGGLDYVSAGPGNTIDPPPGSTTSIQDPITNFVSLAAEAIDSVGFLYSDQGSIYSAESSGTAPLDSWTFTQSPLLAAEPVERWDRLRAGPSLTIAIGATTLFYDGAPDASSDRSIGVAQIDEAGFFQPLDAPVLQAPTGSSYEQPYVQFDPQTQTSRMWFSHFDGTSYSIAYTDSTDGLDFSLPTTVLSLPGQSIGAPVVRAVNGRYRLWASVSDGSQWTHVTATSADGIEWGPLEEFAISNAPYDPRHPPRVAVKTDTTMGWRITGNDNFEAIGLAFGSERFLDGAHGYTFTTALGHEFVPTEVFPQARAANGVSPTSATEINGAEVLFVTIKDSLRRTHIASVTVDNAGVWRVFEPDLLPGSPDTEDLSHPMVYEEAGQYVMFYTATGVDGLSRIRTATSVDGHTFAAVGGDLLDPAEFGDWLGAGQEARSIEVREDGARWLWISGFDGARYSIGAFELEDFSAASPENIIPRIQALENGIQLGTGQPGGADDSGVKDPTVLTIDGTRTLFYSAFDGNAWHLAIATWDEQANAWNRRTESVNDSTIPAMSAQFRTFSSGGVDNPVLRPRQDGRVDLWYAGIDNKDEEFGVRRIGRATHQGLSIFPSLRMPSAGDTLGYETRRGDETVSVIELSQSVGNFSSSGTGTTSIILDEARGMLYLPSKTTGLLYVVDIRDDTRAGAVDRNAFDLETLVRLPTTAGRNGYRGGVLLPERDQLVLTTREPDGLAFLDLTKIIDNSKKEVTELGFIGTLPLLDNAQDAGEKSVALIGGAQPVRSGDLLLVPHFRDNSVVVFDLRLGAFGEEIAYIPYVGENPHQIVLSPDGDYAIVANYLGDADARESSSTLALIDLDPVSPTYLQVTNWIRNQ